MNLFQQRKTTGQIPAEQAVEIRHQVHQPTQRH